LRRTESAWQELQGWLREHASPEAVHVEYAALLDATAHWEAGLGDRLVSDYLGWLIAQGESGQALAAL
jgi:hypothetical protein